MTRNPPTPLLVRALALGAVLTAPALLAGCLDGGPSGAPADAPGPGSTLIEEPGGTAGTGAGHGAINGTVLNENGATLPGVRIILLGTQFVTDSGADGSFLFERVPAGTHTLRADLSGFQSLEHAVTVEEGRVKKVTVTLVTSDGRGSGFQRHFHDYWGDATRLPLLDVALTLPKGRLSGGGPHVACAKTAPSPSINPFNEDVCYTIKFWLPDQVIVYPGTKELEVAVDWAKRDYVTTVEFKFVPANDTRLRAGYVFEPGSTQTIPIGAAMADHGHQRYSLWSFQLHVQPTVAGLVVLNQDDFVDDFVGAFHVTMHAIKGAVEAEPAHVNYWVNGSRVQVDAGNPHIISGVPQERKRDPTVTFCGANDPCFTLANKAFVPPGTTRLEVTLEYRPGTPALDALFSKKSLAFRSAAPNPRTMTLQDLRVEAPAAEEGRKVTWVLALSPEDTDLFYQAKSSWLFLIGNRDHERDAGYAPECWSVAVGCGGETFVLTLTAINDDWVAPAP